MAIEMSLTRTLCATLERCLDVVLPPRCLGCGAMIASKAGLCATCWRGLTLLGPPCCRHCGYPLPQVVADAPLCGACAIRPPIYDRARAALRYDDGARGMILRFKHADRTDIAGTFGRLLLAAGAELLADSDLIVPVPLHRWRLLRRGYNQSALLADTLRRVSGVAMVPDLLQRVVSTRSQQGLSGDQRERNITSSAFRIHPWHRSKVAGRRVVLVDDVLTTGATAAACTRVLRAGGAAAVDLLVLARVVRDAGDTISAMTAGDQADGGLGTTSIN